VECLWPGSAAASELADAGDIPFYESHGEARAASGLYADVIRKREHMLPIARALWKAAGEG
jgi:hypothetical protein